MPILYIDKDMLSSANALAARVPLNTGELDSVSQFASFKPNGPVTNITLLAHTYDTNKTIGNLSPYDLAQNFKKIPEGQRSNLTDIYLIACGAGMFKDGETPLAHQFAIEMFKLGFTNLKVHAATNPANQAISGLRVEVIHKGAGLIKAGSIDAYFYKDKANEKLDEDISKASNDPTPEGVRLHRKLVHDRDMQTQTGTFDRQIIIPTSQVFTYKEQMNKPEHTFTANGVQARYTQTQVSPYVYYAIKYLEDLQKHPERINPDKVKNKDYLAEHLRRIADDITTLKSLSPAADYDAMSGALKHRAPGILVDLLSDSSYYEHIRTMKAAAKPFAVKNKQPLFIETVIPAPDINPNSTNLIGRLLSQTPAQILKDEHILKPKTPRAPSVKPLKNLDEYYGHTARGSDEGRAHGFMAVYKDLKGNLKGDLKGDHLKTAILDTFRSTIDEAADEEALLMIETTLRDSPGFKVLAEGQDKTTRFFGLKTSSVKAFEEMIADKKAAFNSEFKP